MNVIQKKMDYIDGCHLRNEIPDVKGFFVIIFLLLQIRWTHLSGCYHTPIMNAAGLLSDLGDVDYVGLI